jgi:adenylate cyclase
LTTLRKELIAAGANLLMADDQRVELSGDAVEVDAAAIATLSQASDVSSLRHAATLYRGEFLADVSVNDPLFEEWLKIERSRIRDLMTSVFDRLLPLEPAVERVALAKRLLALDPLREASNLALMNAFFDVGERAMALQHYSIFKDMLKSELNVQPGHDIEQFRLRLTSDGHSTSVTSQSALLKAVTQRPRANLLEKLSIAVLPFTNIGGDPNQQYLSDGLTEDIITDLSNAPGFFVIASSSTFAYKGKPTDVRQIAYDLGVKYILEGSVQLAGQRLRINVQLINAAEGGNHIWAERFDRDLSDIFAVQDEVTRRVVEAITGKLGQRPIVERYRPSNLETYDLCVRSRNLWGMSKALNREAYTLLVRAVALDPKYAEVHWQLALVQLFTWVQFGENEEPNRRDALISAERAVDLDPNDSSARWVLGYVLFHERRWDEANAHFEASLRMNPNDADALAIFSDFKLRAGVPEEAMEFVTKALRLNPHPPGWYYWILGDAQVANGQYEYAVATLRREETYRSGSRRILAAALALSGRVEEAREEAKFFLVDNPHFRITKWVGNLAVKDQKDAKFWFDAYLLAGLPE